MLWIKDRLAGDAELNWRDTLPVSEWQGIRLGGTPLRVTGLVYAFQELSGVLPPELGKLDALENLDLTNNRLTGTIPPELGNLTNLRHLDIGVNNLKGEIPSDLGNLRNIVRLDVAQNSLDGEIPSDLGNLTKLESLILGDNFLTGEVPVELENLTRLHEFLIDRNWLTGCVPDGLKVDTAWTGRLIFCGDVPDLWSSRPTFKDGIELTVTFIERTPRYLTQRVAYFGKPSGCAYPFDEFIGVLDCPGQEGMQRKPASGQIVELTAHVWNLGDRPAPAFRYQWLIDNNVTEESEHEGLAVGERVLLKLQYPWPDDSEYPLVTFIVDPSDEISEILEDNNQVNDWIKGSTIGIYFSPTSYESLMLSNESGRSAQSPEHWVHGQADELNRLLKEAGVKERVRLEQFHITEEKYVPSELRWTLDGWWGIWHWPDFYTPDGYRDRPPFDYGLLHEWMHQLGVIDLYTMIIGTHDMVIPDVNRPGELAGCGHPYEHNDYDCFTFPDDVNDLMTYTWPKVGIHTAGALNANFGTRKGFFGEYLYDTPEFTSLKIVDKRGNPVSSATLNFYQQEPGGESGSVIDAIPEFTVTTDDNGIAVLPNRGPIGIPTSTGHQLMPNPFGIIDVVGTNGVMLIEMTSEECTNYEWLTIVELNLAYWDGHTESAEFTKTLRCPPP